MTNSSNSSSTTHSILVIGATGKTGRRVSSRLEARGHMVRRGSRSTAIPFDWDKPETWDRALEGMTRAYVTYFPDIAMPGALDKVEAFTGAAKKAGLQRLVLLSGRGEYHAQQAETLIRGCGLDFTLVRAAWFAQNFSEGELHHPLMDGVLPMPGGAVQEPIIDVDDIADVAVAALSEDRHGGELYEVTGPRLMTFAEMADSLSEAMGRPVHYVPLSFDQFHDALTQSIGPFMADILTTIARETLDGRNACLADGVERALGRKPRDFTDFAAEAAKAGAWRQAA